MPTIPPPNEFRPEDSPIAWFGEMLLSIDRGDFRRASEAQAELTRLGWSVTRQKAGKPRQMAPRRAGGR